MTDDAQTRLDGLEGELMRAREREAELRRLVIEAQERVVELEERLRPLDVRTIDACLRVRRAVARRAPKLARLYRKARRARA